MTRHLLTLLFAILLLGGCATSPDLVIENGERFQSEASAEEYKLGVGDKLRITVFREPTLSGEFAVGSSGSLSLPLVGEIRAAGRTTEDVRREVQATLANGYVRDPRVSMEVMEYRPYFILGEVKAPGQYQYSVGLTVLNSVAAAQGFTPRAARKYVYIRRAGAPAEEAYRLQPNLIVKPGDTIRIAERFF
jgi:polysaccharide export outer membrane protein